LEETIQNPNFIFEGTVSEDRLKELYIGAKAIIAHQKTGTGTLVRIPEALIAGVPVIANTVAARDTRQYNGIYVYDTIKELGDVLSGNLKTPEIPKRPIRYENNFIKKLNI
ncbi:MAG: hypothetical protein ACOCP4_04850, partial [Candidatus Woesearchaeota archaeon]